MQLYSEKKYVREVSCMFYFISLFWMLSFELNETVVMFPESHIRFLSEVIHLPGCREVWMQMSGVMVFWTGLFKEMREPLGNTFSDKVFREEQRNEDLKTKQGDDNVPPGR